MNGVPFGLLAAFFWGAADFAGALAARRASVYRVVLLSEWAGLLALLALPFIFHETFPPLRDLGLTGLGSLLGTIGIIMLYKAMASGQMSVAAPVSAAMAAVVPVIASLLVEGFPGWLKLSGFGLALAAIWLISTGESGSQSARLRLASLWLPLLSGVLFGGYFVLINAGSREYIYWPLISARLVGVLLLLAIVLARRESPLPPRRAWHLALACGVLDVTANVGFVLAGQAGRLDVAAVLGSLYPGMTVVLAWLLLKERLSLSQASGVALALLAIVLIAL